MISMNSSMLASATARPSSTWPRSRALRSSNTVRRVTTSRRCSRKISSSCLQVAQPRLAVDQRHHVDAEGVLQLRLLVQVVQHHLGHFAALELDHHAHAGLVALVLDVADALDLLLVDELGDALEQRLLVHLVRDLVDDDRLALAAVDVLEVALGAHHHLAAPGAVALAHAGQAVDDAGGREVGRRDDLHQLVDRRRRVLQQVQAGVDDLVEVVRRDVGGHADRDAGRAVDQQVRQPRSAAPAALFPSRRSWGRSRRFPCRCRPASRARSSASRISV